MIRPELVKAFSRFPIVVVAVPCYAECAGKTPLKILIYIKFSKSFPACWKKRH